MSVQQLPLFWSYRWLVAALCIAGLVLSSLGALFTAPSYTATAVILPTFDGTPRDAPLPMVDPSILLASQVLLLKSQPISRSIAEQLAKSQSRTTPSLVDTIA